MKYKPGFITYECECEAVSYIWNSRRGEVPQFIPCTRAKCNHVMSPVYAKFRYRAQHTPERFEKVIVNISFTASLKKALAMRPSMASDHPEVQRLAFALYKDGTQPQIILGSDYAAYCRAAQNEVLPPPPQEPVRTVRRVQAA